MSIYIIAILLLGVGITLDQFTKYLAVIHLKNAPIPIIEGVFELHYLENRGAAFGMLQNQQWFFLIIGLFLLVVATITYIKLPCLKRTMPLRICIIFIVCGAIGNMIDRIRLNYVVDFLYFKLINFPIFNVADIYVSVFTFILAVLLLFYYKDEEIDEYFKVFKTKSSTARE